MRKIGVFIDAYWAEDKAHVGNLDWMNRMKKGGEEDVGESLLPNPVHPVHPVKTEPISALTRGVVKKFFDKPGT